jgi:outer membrane lipoprotein carrier protein
VQATPRVAPETTGFQWLRVGFRGSALAAIELQDNFGQRSLLTFADVKTNIAPSADAFRFTPPKGVEVLRP